MSAADRNHLAGAGEVTRLELRLTETLRVRRANRAPALAVELRNLHTLAIELHAGLRVGTLARVRAAAIRDRLLLLARAAEGSSS